jgi:nucleoid-associated protein YgaU
MAGAPVTSFKKAYIESALGDKVEAWFNPKEFTLTRSNKWEMKPVSGQGHPPGPQFGGAEPQKVSIDLLLDDSESPSGDVTRVCGTLLGMMDAKVKAAGKNANRPPTVTFGWGSLLVPFKAVMDSLSIQYLLFRPDGTPIRAIAKVSLTSVEKFTTQSGGGGLKRQNPTTTGIAGVRSHYVRDGDSLQSIAYAAYGDATKWRVIAEANGIDNPVKLRRGTVLSIPNLTG